jgi:hypothetical protein
VRSDPPSVSGELAADCPELPAPRSGLFSDVLEAYMEASRMYYDCADEKRAVVELCNSVGGK